MRPPTARPLFDRALVRVALVDALKKLDPRRMLRNPVMFVVEVGAAFTLALAVQAGLGSGEAPVGFIVAIPVLGHGTWHAYRDLLDVDHLPLRMA